VAIHPVQQRQVFVGLKQDLAATRQVTKAQAQVMPTIASLAEAERESVRVCGVVW
jgi:hypothetical protein